MRVVQTIPPKPHEDEVTHQVTSPDHGQLLPPLLPPKPEPDEEKRVVLFHCQNPNCGQYVDAEDVDVIDQTEKGSVFKTTVWAGHYDEGHIVRFKWIVKKVTAWNNKLQVTYTNYLVIFNPYTGQTYLFEPYENGKRAKWYPGPKIQNCTYQYRSIQQIIPYLPSEIYMDLYATLATKIAKHLGYSPLDLLQSVQQYIDYQHEEKVQKQKRDAARNGRRGSFIPTPVLKDPNAQPTIGIHTLALFVRFPNLNPFMMEDLVHQASTVKYISDKEPKVYPIMKKNSLGELIKDGDKTIMEKRTHPVNRIAPWVSKVKNIDPNPIGKMMELFKIPSTKSYRKLILADPKRIFEIQLAFKLFKEPANILAAVKSGILSNHSNYTEKLLWGEERPETLLDFIDEMIAKFGETIFVNKMIPNGVGAYSILRDTGSLYYQIRRKNPSLDIDCRGSIYEMHDNFSKILDSIKHKNYVLEYSDYLKGLELQEGDLRIRPAVDTNELRFIGRTMRICVGGYADRARNQNCHIFLMTDGDQYKMCIEMSSDGKAVKQAKLQSNYIPETGEAIYDQFVQDWIHRTGLLVATGDLPELYLKHSSTRHVYDDLKRSGASEERLQALPVTLDPDPVENPNPLPRNRNVDADLDDEVAEELPVVELQVQPVHQLHAMDLGARQQFGDNDRNDPYRRPFIDEIPVEEIDIQEEVF